MAVFNYNGALVNLSTTGAISNNNKEQMIWLDFELTVEPSQGAPLLKAYTR